MQLTETDHQSQAVQVIDINEAIDLEKIGSEMRSFLEIMNQPMSVEAFDACVDEIGEFLKEHGYEECPHKYNHQFPDGLYYRESTMGPLEFVLGKKHKQRTCNMLLSGSLILFTNDGPIVLSAPMQFTSEKDCQKLAITITEVIFANIFPNPDECRDISALEDRYAHKDNLELMEVAK